MNVAHPRFAGFWQRLRYSGRAFAAGRCNPTLRRVLLSFGAAWTAEWALTVALGVVAFRTGGALPIWVVAFARMAPSALLAPLSSALADRWRRDHVLILSSLIRGGAITAAALLLAWEAPLVTVYLFAVLATAAFIVFRPAHSALLPALCASPIELTSANVVRGLLDSLSTLLGPLAAALLLAVASPVAAFAFAGALSLGAGALLFHLPYEAPQRVSPWGLRRTLSDTSAGFRALSRHRDAGLLIGLALAQTFTRHCLTA